jgi:uracil-DNA glycosylase
MAQMSNDKLKVNFISPKKDGKTIIIVGQNPGHNRDGTNTGTVWEKNRSARLLWSAIGESQNIILTNICNYTDMDEEKIHEGLTDLKDLMNEYKPAKVIVLGDFAYKWLKFSLYSSAYKPEETVSVFKLHHPSYIARFNKGSEEWKKKVRRLLK